MTYASNLSARFGVPGSSSLLDEKRPADDAPYPEPDLAT